LGETLGSDIKDQAWTLMIFLPLCQHSGGKEVFLCMYKKTNIKKNNIFESFDLIIKIFSSDKKTRKILK